MTKHIVALSIDKVQTLLFQIIRSHEQEKQVETATLRDITHSSYEISRGFFNDIQEAFPEPGNEKLLACSGVYIFECTLEQDEIKRRLKALFKKYYTASQGQKILKYTFFDADGCDKITAIQKAKYQLKQAKCLNEIIQTNEDFLFDFQPAPAPDNQPNLTLDRKQYKTFVQGMNKLYSYGEQNEENPYKDNHFRVAIIKADLDGMGSMFQQINNYATYSQISDLLNDNISLSGLDKAAKNFAPEKKAKWIFPFYAAGDDIFFAVSIANFMKGIDVCRHMLQSINNQLKEFGATKLKMSIGVDFTFNREPIRYYIDRVESQLECAKKAECPVELMKYLQSKIAINNLAFFDVDYDQIKIYKKSLANHKKKSINQALKCAPIWGFFLSDLKILNRAKSADAKKELGSHSFFYSLLERLTDEKICNNDVLYMNNLLYHLLPQYLESANKQLRKSELLLKTAIISQLYQKTSLGDAIILCDDTKHRLETYLRLMLLLTDTRFSIVESQQKPSSFNANEKKNVKKYLFTKPADYLYSSLLKRGKLFLNTLIKKGFNGNIPYFRRVKIEKSMFFRLRDIKKFPIEKAAIMIEACNIPLEEAVRPKSPYRLDFNKNAFCRRAFGKWTPDFVDSLMLLFAYIEATIQFKGRVKEEK